MFPPRPILALTLAFALPAAAQDAPAPDAATELAPAAVIVRLEGVRIEIDAAEIELLLGPADLARALGALPRRGEAPGPEASD